MTYQRLGIRCIDTRSHSDFLSEMKSIISSDDDLGRETIIAKPCVAEAVLQS